MTLNSLSLICAEVARGLGNHLWQSTVFVGVVALLGLALRKHQARVRYGLWLAASVKFLIPFALLIAVGSHLARPTHPMGSQTPVYMAMDEMSQPFTDVTALNPPITPTAARQTKTHHPTFPLPALLATVWLCGVMMVLAFWSMQWWRVRRLMRQAKPLREGREADALRRIEQMAGVTRRIELLSSPGPMEPGVLGIVRPVLLWPEGISQHLDDAHLEAVLAHEVCHVRRRDNLTAVVHMLVEVLFWFYLPVWWMERQLVKERERACDEAVLLLCNQPQAYAESILKVCEFCAESPLTCVSGITGADLKRRIVQIMTEGIAHKLDFGRKLLLLAVGLGIVAGPIMLGQAKATRRMMLAAVEKAPLPFRTAVHAMIAEVQTPSSTELLEAQATPSQTLPGSSQSPPIQGAPIPPTATQDGTPPQPPILAPLTNRVPSPCPSAPPQPVVAGPNMSQYSAERESEMASANALVNCHDYAGAYALYVGVLEKYPNDARALMMAGEDAIWAGRVEESASLLERSLAHSPNNKYSWNVRDMLMRVYIHLGRWQELEAERLDTRRASLAGDTTLPADKGYPIEQFRTAAGEYVDTIEFPALHGPNQTREQFVLVQEKDHCTGFTPHIDLDSPDADHVFFLDAYTTADSRTRLNSYPNGEPSYQTMRNDVLSALSKGPLVTHNGDKPCTTGPLAGGQLPPVTFHLQKQGGSPWPLKLVQLLLDGQPVALDAPVPVSGMWMRNITIVLQNNSPKNVVLAEITLLFTDTGTGETASPYESLPMHVGVYPENAFLHPNGTRQQIPASEQGPPINVPPGGTIELATGDVDYVQSAVYAKAPITTIELVEGTVFFNDDCKWSVGGYYVPAPLPQVWKGVTPDEFSQWNPSTGR